MDTPRSGQPLYNGQPSWKGIKLPYMYSGTSISGGAWDGNFRVSPHSPVIICAKKELYFKIFLPLNSPNY